LDKLRWGEMVTSLPYFALKEATFMDDFGIKN